MGAQLIKPDEHELTIPMTVNISGTMMDAEESLPRAVNEVGRLATEKALQQFDPNGSAVMTGDLNWTKRTTSPPKYQTPSGEIEMERHVDQTSQGGRIDCPLEPSARIIRHATPRFAKPQSHQYAELNVNQVCRDRQPNQGRKIAAS